MPRYTDQTGEEDFYSDDTPNVGESRGAEAETGQAEYEGATATLPKSILMGKTFEPGDELVLRIVSLQDDEIVVEYAAAEPESETAEPEAPAPPEEATPDAEMAGMMG